MAILIKTKIPGPKSLALMKERQAAVARGPFHVTPIFISRAEGATIEDVDGNRFIDFAAGISVVNVGHCNPAVVSAVQEQTTKFLHAGFNITPYENYIRLCEKLNEAFRRLNPVPAKSFLANSGAEAVENAIKIARMATGRQAIVCFDHAFHGRTYMAMTLTAKSKPYRYGFAPFNPEVYRAPFPYVYRWPTPNVAEECFQAFLNVAQAQVSPTQIAAVIFEPVLGEGGFVPILPEFLKKLRAFCDEHKIVLIADEIQTGFGRTGTFFASEQLGVAPDLLITAKSLGAGLPISGVTGRAEIMDAPIEGGIGGTFGGNPLACAAALAVFDVIEKGDLLKNAKAIAVTLQQCLALWKSKYELIGDIRGIGPMQGIEFVKSRKTKEPHPDAAKAVVRYAYEHGVISMTAGTYSNVVRLLMPLTITNAELTEGLDVLEKALAQTA
jgi:4-aminobutyrate aminotransferase / (S)-3-amino-2-methylpropionate transaminase / 5-aminovalerate transaminase